jgi:pilus assembly protein Flp/PilA
MPSLKQLVKDQAGVSAVEYGLLLAFIALALLAAATILWANLSSKLNKLAVHLGN